MNVVGHGVDLVVCSRIERIWKQHGAVFLGRVYTSAEQRYCLEKADAAMRLAARFAVKEAVLKALGTGWRGGLRFTDIETLHDPLGRPVVSLHGETAALAQRHGAARVLVSISHAGDLAIASAILVSS